MIAIVTHKRKLKTLFKKNTQKINKLFKKNTQKIKSAEKFVKIWNIDHLNVQVNVDFTFILEKIWRLQQGELMNS